MASLMKMVNLVSRCGAMYRAEHSEGNLRGIYHSYIFEIHKTPGMSQDKLAKQLCVNKSSVTRHISFLESEGYVERRPSAEDKREMLVYPTEKLESVYPDILSINRKWNALMTRDLSEEEIELFYGVIEKLADRARRIVYSEEDGE